MPTNIVESLQLGGSNLCKANVGQGLICFVGDMSKSPEIAVFGDSHSGAMLPAFDVIGKRLGHGVVHIELSGCPPLLGIDILNGNHGLGPCKKTAEREFEYVKQNKIKKVFLVARWTLYTESNYDGSGIYYLGSKINDVRTKEVSRQLFYEALIRTKQAYRDIGADVYVVAQVPQQKTDASLLYSKMYNFGYIKDVTLEELSVTKSQHLRLQKFSRDVFVKNFANDIGKVIVVDDVFCNEDLCLIGKSDKSFYSDESHLSNVGALMVVDEIMKHFN